MSAWRDERVVVIGAGIGGLAAALRLAAAGAQVTVLDRHAWPGGRIRTVPSAAGPVDAGPTVLTLRPVLEALFAGAGARLADHVALEPEPLLARHWWPDGSRLDLFADREASAAAIRGFAGAAAEAEFRRFAARAEALFAAFDAPVMRAPAPRLLPLALRALADLPRLLPALLPGRSLAGLLAREFRDPRLRQLFGRYATYVGGSPFAAPAVLALVWRAEEAGVWRVRGGMAALARGLAAAAAAAGARLRLGREAARIEVAGGRARAVVLTDGERIAADRILHAGDPAALRAGLLGAEARRAVAAAGVAPRSLSAHVWCFAARPSRGDLVHHNVFFGQDPAAEFAALRAGRMPADPTLYVCAEDRGTGRPDPSGPERFEIILNAAPAGPGASTSAEEAERCRRTVFGTLARAGLAFDPEPGRAALTGPADFARLFPGTGGAIYGRSPEGLAATFLRPRARSRLAGLYLAGGGVHPGPGLPMAALSGLHAAAAMLADRDSMSRSRRTAMPGGISTASPGTAAAPSRSSAS